ncbi:MAG TPA: nickel-dependent lactate racemase [Nitrospirota bacterium]|nr:nickel-dependent lactate racemase [Nitrospirota bacterium]
MQTIKFPYGETQIDLELEQPVEVLMPTLIPGVADELRTIHQSLQHPIGSERLSKIAQEKKTTAIVINDITRPSPTETMLTAILEELAISGIGTQDITVIVATGNHELPSEEELKKIMGIWYSGIKTVLHDCNDKNSLTYVGSTRGGMPVHVNTHYAKASLKILTGIITPHQLAGFSGGRKSVVPGIAGIQTLQKHHSFPIRPATSMHGIIAGNTFHSEAVEGTRLAGVDFIVNVVKNYHGEIIEAVAGDLEKAHMYGVGICEKSWVRKFDKAYDIVFVSPGRYPKDVDLHQAQKAVGVAEQVTKPGGTIVLIAECRKGIGKFGKVLKEADSLDTVIKEFTEKGFTPDQNSKAYLLARACKKHKLLVVTTGIDKKELSEMFMTGFTSISEAAKAAIALHDCATILCIPYAGECIPVVAKS